MRRAVENSKKDKSYSSYLEQAGSESDLLLQFKEGVLEELTRNRIIDEIAESEKIQVSEEELQQTAQRLAPQWGISPERAKELIKSREDVREDFTDSIRRSKVLDLIASKAKIKELDHTAAEEPEENQSDSSGSLDSEENK